MHTYFLGSEEVLAYLRDATARLPLIFTDSEAGRPPVLVSLGTSGDELLRRWIDEIQPPLSDGVSFLRAARLADGSVEYRDEDDATLTGQALADRVKGRSCLVVDSSAHSGRSLLAGWEPLASAGAADVFTYALTLKAGSCITPTIWSLTLGDADRCYFLLDRLPNHRLAWAADDAAGLKPSRSAFQLVDASNVPASMRPNWADALPRSSHYTSRLLLQGMEAVGSVTHGRSGGRFVVAAIHAVGSAEASAPQVKMQERSLIWQRLLRVAETLARSGDADSFEIWLPEDNLQHYLDRGFDVNPDVESDEQGRTLLRRSLLTHLPRAETLKADD